MLNIIINYEKYNTYNEILDYIYHINNINNNTISINIYILNCNNKYTVSDLDNTIINNINIFIYTFNVNYTDSILNDIVSNTKYDYILFTKLDIYLTYDFIDWIKLNSIKDTYFIRNNIFELKNISDKFTNSYDNNIYYDIMNNLDTIINEKGINNINNIEFMENFNNDINVKIINTKNIKEKSLYYLHNTNDFIIIHKNIIKKHGFNIENNNINLTYQYFILNLLNNNYDMHILPFRVSSYKLKNENKEYDLIDINKKFSCSADFNKHINYKIYNILCKQEQSYIRDQIKSYRGYNPTKTIAENTYLKNQNKELLETNSKYSNILKDTKTKLNYYFKNKWYIIYIKYGKLNKILDNMRNKIVATFKILNL